MPGCQGFIVLLFVHAALWKMSPRKRNLATSFTPISQLRPWKICILKTTKSKAKHVEGVFMGSESHWIHPSLKSNYPDKQAVQFPVCPRTERVSTKAPATHNSVWFYANDPHRTDAQTFVLHNDLIWNWKSERSVATLFNKFLKMTSIERAHRLEEQRVTFKSKI